MSHKFCDKCNRVRLTCDGMLRLCLQSGEGIDLKAMLRAGASEEEIKTSIGEALSKKPREHCFQVSQIQADGMSQIGG